MAKTEPQKEKVVPVTDGGYGGRDNTKLASEKNVKLITTALIGKEAPDVLADFEFNESGTKLLKCAAGHAPRSCNYTKSTKQCHVSFDAEHCRSCPYKEQCTPGFGKTVAKFITSQNASNKAKSQRFMQSEEFKNYAKIRNGVEAVPANIRRNYHLEKMPRGKQRGSLRMGLRMQITS